MLALAERGDLGGMSFGFNARDESIDGNRRELRAVDLFEISVVAAFPAYDGTVINARAVAVILGKEAVYRSMYGREMVATGDEPPPAAAGGYLKSLASDSQSDLDATVQRISGAYRLLRLEQGNRG